MNEKSCSNCRNQMAGFDGGFFGLPFTCECRIYGETENRKNCSDFEKAITKSYLLDKIKELEKENEELKAKASSWKITCSQESNEKNVLFMKNRQLQEENEQLKIANAKWLDKSLQDKQMRYSNAKCKGLTQKYLQLKNENEQLRQVVEEYRKTIKHLSELCADASKNGYLPPLEDLR